jgi:hypothetical protein
MTEFSFATADGDEIVVRAEDKFKDISGSYPTYSARTGLVFRVDAGTEPDVTLAADIISKQVGTLLGSEQVVTRENIVEYIGQSSLSSEQMMTTIMKALQEAGITQKQNEKVTPLRFFITKLRSKNASQ